MDQTLQNVLQALGDASASVIIKSNLNGFLDKLLSIAPEYHAPLSEYILQMPQAEVLDYYFELLGNLLKHKHDQRLVSKIICPVFEGPLSKWNNISMTSDSLWWDLTVRQILERPSATTPFLNTIISGWALACRTIPREHGALSDEMSRFVLLCKRWLEGGQGDAQSACFTQLLLSKKCFSNLCMLRCINHLIPQLNLMEPEFGRLYEESREPEERSLLIQILAQSGFEGEGLLGRIVNQYRKVGSFGDYIDLMADISTVNDFGASINFAALILAAKSKFPALSDEQLEILCDSLPDLKLCSVQIAFLQVIQSMQSSIRDKLLCISYRCEPLIANLLEFWDLAILDESSLREIFLSESPSSTGKQIASLIVSENLENYEDLKPLYEQLRRFGANNLAQAFSKLIATKLDQVPVVVDLLHCVSPDAAANYLRLHPECQFSKDDVNLLVRLYQSHPEQFKESYEKAKDEYLRDIWIPSVLDQIEAAHLSHAFVIGSHECLADCYCD